MASRTVAEELLYNVYSSLTVWGIVLYLLLLLATWCAYRVCIYPFISPLRHLPGPPCYNPITGNIAEMLKSEAIDLSIKWAKKYGTMFRYAFLFGSERVLIANPEGFKHVFVTHSKNYQRIYGSLQNSIFSKIIKQGVLSLSGDKHLARRKILNPAFKYSLIKGMVTTIQGRAQEFVTKWQKELDSNDTITIEINKSLSMLTMDVIGLSAFGYDFGCIQDPDTEQNEATHRLLSLGGLSLKALIPGVRRIPFLKENIQMNNDFKILYSSIENVIQEKLRNLKSGDENILGKKNMDLLDLLLKEMDDNDEKLSEEILRDEIVTFMVAGHETTSTAMSWFLTMMAKHPDIQERVRQEVIQGLPPRGENISTDQVDGLKYLTSAIKETLRLYPPVPLTMRGAVNDDYIQGQFIPKGTQLILNAGCMMRLEEFYPDPLVYNPDRFLNEKAMDPYKFMPFISGPYMCIGYKFAMLEMKVVLAMLLREFSFSCDKDLKFKKKQKITLKADPPIKLHVRLQGALEE